MKAVYYEGVRECTGEGTELRIVRKKETSDNDVHSRAYETFK